LFVAALLPIGCDPPSQPPAPAPSAKLDVPAVTSAPVPSAAPSALAIAPAAPAAAPPRTDRAAFGCSLLEPARALTHTGPVALVWEGPDARGRPTVVFNADGSPERVSGLVSLGDAPAAETQSPACAAAPPFLYCLGGGGDVRRFGPDGGPVPVARARARMSIAAAPLGGRVVLAYLAETVTSEGIILAARVGYDGGPPLTLSEEGSGATFVTLASWGERVFAVYADERAAMTPVHARVLTAGPGDRPLLGPDAVIFVGDGGARVQTAVARGAEGQAFALVPSTRDEKTFGLAAVHLADPPEVDARAHWSPYPAGLLPAAVATPHLSSAPVALRVRPADADPRGKKVLELGRIAPNGAFEEPCSITAGQSLQDLAVEVDAEGAVWIAYAKGTRTYLERRGRVEASPKP